MIAKMSNIYIKYKLLNLLSIKKFGPKSLKKVTKRYGKDFNGKLDFKNIKENIRKEIERKYADDTTELKKYFEDRRINFKFYFEKGYPSLLKEIYGFPPILFLKGNADLLESKKMISVVGTRKSTSYGEMVVKNLVSKLVSRGYVIVSGMAMGIDKVAHDEALKLGGKTIAVLASSVEDPTPKINTNLYHRILNGDGLIVSQTKPNTKVQKGMFASRNQIVAGLSLATLVVEAPEKSGALITAKLSLDYGREVFAVPGDINKNNSFGTNELIKDGSAKLIQSVEDIVEEIEGFRPESQSVDLDLDNQEESVVSLLSASKNFDEIKKLVKMESSVLNELLMDLEIRNIISRGSDGKYVRLK